MKLPELKRGGSKRALNAAGGDIKVPKFFTDLYADLRDRRLLPLVVLLLVAIVAAPFLLGSKGESEETPEVAAIPAVAEGATAQGSFTVTPAARELRAYGNRLGYRKARNPFGSAAGSGGPSRKSGHATQEHQSGAEESGGVETTGVESEASTGGEVPTGGDATTIEPERVVVQPKVVKATLKAQVGVAAVVKAGFAGSKPKELELEAQARLPRKSPAIVYTGTSKKGGALFLMTSQVSEFSGDGHCVLGGASCQIVELKRKGSETFRIGYGKTHYKVHLLGYEPIVKEEVVEAEGKKIRIPSKEKNEKPKSRSERHSGETVGSEPAPRWMLR